MHANKKVSMHVRYLCMRITSTLERLARVSCQKYIDSQGQLLLSLRHSFVYKTNSMVCLFHCYILLLELKVKKHVSYTLVTHIPKCRTDILAQASASKILGVCVGSGFT